MTYTIHHIMPTLTITQRQRLRASGLGIVLAPCVSSVEARSIVDDLYEAGVASAAVSDSTGRISFRSPHPRARRRLARVPDGRVQIEREAVTALLLWKRGAVAA